MNASMLLKSRSLVLRMGLVTFALATVVAMAAEGCTLGGWGGGGSGDRCNPDLSHNDCNGSLVCAGFPPSSVLIPNCPENYCCSVDSNGNLNDPNPLCQPGCNGGAAAICAADSTQTAACAAACMADPTNAAACAAAPSPDAGGDAGSD